MLAYVKSMELCEDDGTVIGVLEHTENTMYVFKPKASIPYITPDEYRFIAKVMESEILKLEVE